MCSCSCPGVDGRAAQNSTGGHGDGEQRNGSAQGFRVHPMTVKFFAVVSSYRTGDGSFTVVGVSLLKAELHLTGGIVDSCIWKEPTGTIHETLAESLHLRSSEYVNRPWGTVLIRCAFNASIGSDNSGGVLYLQKHMHHHETKSGLPGYAFAPALGASPLNADTRQMLVMKEDAGDFRKVTNPPAYNLSYCSGPLYHNMAPRPTLEFLHYHEAVVGVAHFFLYDSGALTSSKEMEAGVEGYRSRGLATVTRLKGLQHYASHLYHQVASQNDCLYRNYYLSKWVLFTDVDEYVFTPPPATFLSFLTNQSWASMGSYPASTKTCSKRHTGNAEAERELMVQHLPWRSPLPMCSGQKDAFFCPSSVGRRKVVVRSQEVSMVSVHRIELPVGAYGVVWNASMQAPTPKMLHFRGLPMLNPDYECTIRVDASGEVEDGKIFDTTFGSYVESALN